MNDPITLDTLLDWQGEAEARRREADEAPVERGTKGSGPAQLPWPPREVTEEELARGPTRKCKKCGGVYPETTEFFEFKKGRRHSSGNSWNKACFRLECMGCRRKQQRGVYNFKYGRRYRRLHGGAKRRGIEWGFAPEDLHEFYDAPCHYCGGEVVQRLGLDRVDNNKGYVPGNVVQCCAMCNRMKSDHPEDEWFALMRKILAHHA